MAIMTESEINLDTISNLKHRAILQALLTADLPVNAISRKLQCNSGAIYYCIKRYLYKGFSEERNKRIQLNKLSSCAATKSVESSSCIDVVTEVKILPADTSSKALPAPEPLEVSVSSIESTENIEDDEHTSTCVQDADSAKKSQQKLYDFIENVLQKYPEPRFLRFKKLYRLYRNGYGIGGYPREVCDSWNIDGDGAVLWHNGGIAVIENNNPKIPIHIVINNGTHENVGGMPTVCH